MLENNRNSKSKNGKIELLRFIFCIVVLLFHLEKYLMGEPKLDMGNLTIALCPHGSIGVEFFFIVSGFLMGKTIYKKISTNNQLAGNNINNQLSKEYINFLIRKIRGIFPQHCIAFIFAFISYVIFHEITGKKIILTFINSLPNLFLIQMTGFRITNPNNIEWYICCMFIAMAIIYPICRKWYYTFTRYFAPLGSLLVLGFLMYTTHSLTGVETWMGICYKSMIRAICEISLGTTAFEISRYISKIQFSKSNRVGLTTIEFLSFIFTMIFVVSTFTKDYEFYALILIIVLVVLCFSEVTYGNKLFNNKFVYHLGEMSLPIYLAQMSGIYLTEAYFLNLSIYKQLFIAISITLIIAYFIFFVSKTLKLR
ncbi:MAG: acyltransferase family protein [Erysipelotrichaceae bacterium]|nr:acyltransferase family protein [Erysipelotrichaceae bacterium]